MYPDYTPAPGEPKCRQSKAILIKVRDVEADFTVDSLAMPIFKFTNTSTNAVQYWWDFGVGQGFIPCPAADPSNCPNAQYNYEDRVDSFRVCLIALSPEGCYDTTCKVVFNSFETSINIPNVFTPNGDGANDVFNVQLKGWNKYNIQVFNRFSDKVFESDDPDNPWNGKLNNTGADLPPGVYYVVITYTLRGGVEQTYNGTITLIR